MKQQILTQEFFNFFQRYISFISLIFLYSSTVKTCFLINVYIQQEDIPDVVFQKLMIFFWQFLEEFSCLKFFEHISLCIISFVAYILSTILLQISVSIDWHTILLTAGCTLITLLKTLVMLRCKFSNEKVHSADFLYCNNMKFYILNKNCRFWWINWKMDRKKRNTERERKRLERKRKQ